MNEIVAARLGRQTMRVTADTNVLVRAFTGDHPQQSKVRPGWLLGKAELVALSITDAL